jgi:hypothetical protein
MNLIVLAIVLTGVILLIYDLVKRCDRATDSEALQEKVQQRLEDAGHRSAEESPHLSDGGISWLTQQTQADTKPVENVTSSLTNATEQSRCPACGAIITANDERCPACEISFVTDGNSFITDRLQKWTPRAVGPADGIYRPATDFRERPSSD